MGGAWNDSGAEFGHHRGEIEREANGVRVR